MANTVKITIFITIKCKNRFNLYLNIQGKLGAGFSAASGPLRAGAALAKGPEGEFLHIDQRRIYIIT
jgi:hypothetical protein